MSEFPITNVNVISQELLPTPEEIKSKLPLDQETENQILEARDVIRNILDHKDHRIFVVVGPCSIHDTKSAMEYATKLKALAEELKDTIYIVMRVYFEKPRTTVGWKGLINDPKMDDSFDIKEGLHTARKLLIDISRLGLPIATEALDPITPQYIADTITWTAIGARTTESQTHREMASGLSTPIGFKNGTDGSLDVAINALHSASSPHHFLGINQQGACAVIHTRGNAYGHVVLRGGGGQANYDSVNIKLCEEALAAANLPPNISVDCSHGNSHKKPELQPLVVDNCVNQILEGNKSITSLMLESNLNWGSQAIPEDLSQLKYGVSVTDACIDWETTEKVLRDAREKLKDVLPGRFKS
ncbi:MAG: 3-deoxy-7-phosphoheptulonate synthase [Gammaproteobacteria bacterium]|nr:3-deoxy-7-phosphoheptulonate synthase [Gammaproteobacteria bacterium]